MSGTQGQVAGQPVGQPIVMPDGQINPAWAQYFQQVEMRLLAQERRP